LHSETVKIKLLKNSVGKSREQLNTSILPLFCCVAKGSKVILAPGDRCAVATGIALDLPELLEAVVLPNPVLAEKLGVTVLNSPGTIDPDFKGEIQVILINHGGQEAVFDRGDQIAELRIQAFVRANFEEVLTLSSSARGKKGLGSTGK